jgi:hypothetical protein
MADVAGVHMRILVGVVGPSCDGGLSDFNTELLLPAYTALAVSTKVPVMGQYGYGLGFRIAPMGGMFWVDVPVVTYKKLDGMGGAGNTTKMGAAISSGLNSFVNPTQWVTVFDAPRR